MCCARVAKGHRRLVKVECGGACALKREWKWSCGGEEDQRRSLSPVEVEVTEGHEGLCLEGD
jgi:hypothetical protein